MKHKIAIILGLSLAAFAQRPAHPRAWAAFRDGMSKAQVHAAFGPPTGHFYGTGGIVEDIYIRRTARNTYRYEVTYGFDMSVSQLHPTETINWVTCIPDRMVPSGKINELLEDLPEAKRLCAGGCSLYKENGGAYVLEPAHPTAEQIDGADTVHDAVLNSALRWR